MHTGTIYLLILLSILDLILLNADTYYSINNSCMHVTSTNTGIILYYNIIVDALNVERIGRM
jgi:hypothetical protein